MINKPLLQTLLESKVRSKALLYIDFLKEEGQHRMSQEDFEQAITALQRLQKAHSMKRNEAENGLLRANVRSARNAVY
jgi:hypothetical protein